MSDILNVASTPSFDNRITKIEVHAYNPYANTNLGNSDEIRIPIQQQDLYTLPSDSYLYVELRLTQSPLEEKQAPLVTWGNNCIAYLFDEIRYEINGIEVDRCKNVGITTTMKNFVSMSPTESDNAKNAGWFFDYHISPDHTTFCVPLRMLMGIFEDYRRIVMNARQELVLIRSRADIHSLTGKVADSNCSVEVHKAQWRVPHVTLDEVTRLALLRILESGRSLTMSFRSWDLYEYPLLPKTKKHTWTVKTATQLEKPRYVMFEMQRARKNDMTKSPAQFDACSLTDLRLYLNSEYYPYDGLNVDFEKKKYAILYEMYNKFRRSYYGLSGSAPPMMDIANFFQYAPLVVIDCSRQNDSIKSASVDVRIDFECNNDVPNNTAAYCLIIHDSIVDYNPLTGAVRKIT